MQQHTVRTDTASAISRYFAKAHLPTQQETLGEIVTEILKVDWPLYFHTLFIT